MERKNTFHREKNFVLSPLDELAYSRVLRDEYPGVMFLQDDYSSHPSNMPVIASIAHSQTERIQIIIPSPGQEERMKINHDFCTVMVQPECRFQYDRSHWEYFSDPTKKFAFDSPLHGWGILISSFPRDDEKNKRFSARVIRLVNKVCGTSSIGYDAMRISREGGKRCAVGIGTHINEPGPFCHLPWYQDDRWNDDPTNITSLPECGGFRR